MPGIAPCAGGVVGHNGGRNVGSCQCAYVPGPLTTLENALPEASTVMVPRGQAIPARSIQANSAGLSVTHSAPWPASRPGRSDVR